MNTDAILLIIGLVAISLLISGFIIFLNYLNKRKVLATICIGSYEFSIPDKYRFKGRIPHWIKKQIRNTKTLPTIIYGTHYDVMITAGGNEWGCSGSIYKRWHK